jgi:UDP-glucuronate decarboxylase
MTESLSRVLVAGGAGFLGSHLCEALLARGNSVICVDSLLTGKEDNLEGFQDNPAFTFVKQDILDPIPGRLRADAVINLACPASPPHYSADPVHTMMTSVIGTHNLLQFALAQRARFLQASTSEIYGDPLAHPQVEGYFGNVNPNGPRACYDEGKRAAETLCCDYARREQLDARILRIFNTYGPRMRVDDGRVVSNVICQALAGKDITIYGDGSQTRSFCYVDDLIDGIVKLLDYEGPPLGAVNLGNPTEITVAGLVRKVLALTKSPSRPVHAPLPLDDPQRRCPDIRKAKEHLGWRPSTTLDKGLRRTITWFAQSVRPAPLVPPARRIGRGAAGTRPAAARTVAAKPAGAE